MLKITKLVFRLVFLCIFQALSFKILGSKISFGKSGAEINNPVKLNNEIPNIPANMASKNLQRRYSANPTTSSKLETQINDDLRTHNKTAGSSTKYNINVYEKNPIIQKFMTSVHSLDFSSPDQYLDKMDLSDEDGKIEKSEEIRQSVEKSDDYLRTYTVQNSQVTYKNGQGSNTTLFRKVTASVEKIQENVKDNQNMDIDDDGNAIFMFVENFVQIKIHFSN